MKINEREQYCSLLVSSVEWYVSAHNECVDGAVWQKWKQKGEVNENGLFEHKTWMDTPENGSNARGWSHLYGGSRSAEQDLSNWAKVGVGVVRVAERLVEQSLRIRRKRRTCFEKT